MTQLSDTANLPREPATAARTAPRVNWAAMTGVIVLVGAALRVAQYASRQSYWNDEAFLVLNIFDHTARQLLGPLNFEQAAPPLFLLAMRGVHVLLGRGEYAMRLLPLLLAIGALVVFARLARTTLPPLVAAVVVALCAVSNHLITHAAETKQYSGDVFVAALMLLLALHGAPHVPAHRRLGRASLFATVALWFSHPAAFTFGGVALALGWSALREPREPREPRAHVMRIVGAVALPAVSFVVLYFVSIRQQQSRMLFDYWAGKFVPVSWTMPAWLVLSTINLFDYAYDKGGALLFPLGVLGAAHLWRGGRRELLAALVAPAALVLAAAALRRYPFGGTRLTLFLAPALLMLVGFGLDALRQRLAPRRGWWWVALVLVILAVDGAIAAYHLLAPRYRGNMRPVVEHIAAHRKPDEPVFALRAAEFRVYWSGAIDEHIHIGHWPERFPAHGRFWVALSVGQGSNKLAKELPYNQRGLGQPTRVTTWRGGGALYFDRETVSSAAAAATTTTTTAQPAKDD